MSDLEFESNHFERIQLSNAVAYSPDGNMIAGCSGWGGSNVCSYFYNAMTEQKCGRTHFDFCLDIAWSPDSSQAAFSHSYYQGDGASINIFYATTGVQVDTLSAPRPGGCSSGGGGNNCGQVNGLDWHPDGNYIISAHGRNDEGVYHWLVDPDIDGDGYLNPDDAFRRWYTMERYGRRQLRRQPCPATEPDACPNEFGTSYMDVFVAWMQMVDGYWMMEMHSMQIPISGADNDGDGYPSNINDPRQPNPYGSVIILMKTQLNGQTLI